MFSIKGPGELFSDSEKALIQLALERNKQDRFASVHDQMTERLVQVSGQSNNAGCLGQFWQLIINIKNRK